MPGPARPRHTGFVVGALTLTTLLTARVAYTAWESSPDALMNRLCERQNYTPPIDCHPKISSAQSSLTLASYKQQVETWAEAPLPQSQNLFDDRRWAPKYWLLPLRFADRVAAEKARTAAQDVFNGRVEADLKEGLKDGRYHTANVPAYYGKANDVGKIPGSTHILKMALWVIGIFAIAAIAVSMFLAAKKGDLKRAGFEDREEPYRRMLRMYLLIGCAIGAVPAATLYFTGHPWLAGLVMVIAFAGARTAQNRVWVMTNQGSVTVWEPSTTGAKGESNGQFKDIRVDSPRFRRTPPPPVAQTEHGSARHAADQELHAKGFAERETGPDGDAAMYAHLATLSDGDLKAAGDRLGAIITRSRNGKISIKKKGSRA